MPVPFTVQQQVQQDDGHRTHGDAAVQDHLHLGRQVRVDPLERGRQHRQRDGHTDDQCTGFVPGHGGQRPDSGRHDHAEQGDTGTAQHRLRDTGGDLTDLRQQAEDDENEAGGGDHVAAGNTGERHQADVLGEGRGRRCGTAVVAGRPGGCRLRRRRRWFRRAGLRLRFPMLLGWVCCLWSWPVSSLGRSSIRRARAGVGCAGAHGPRRARR